MDRLLMNDRINARRRLLPPALACAALLVAATAHAATGDATRGADAFADNCGDCHAVKPDGGNRKGPNLFGIIGRKSSAIADFEYSDANKALNWVWTEERLEPYLAAPKKVVPGTIMKFKGDPDPQERADIIAYLKTLHN
jgi:cytochrome c